MSDDSSDNELDGPYYPEQDVLGGQVDALIEAIVEDPPGEFANMLLDHPEIIDMPGGPTQCTALQIASLIGRLEVVRFLLENGADVHNKGVIRFAPIHYASKAESPHSHKVAELLLSHGANVHDRDTALNMTPLNIAIKSGSEKMVQILLAHGADPRDRDFPQNHPLHMACCEGHLEMVEMLLDNGANLHDYDDKGKTPLHLSCEGGNLFYDSATDTVPIVCCLLENGADPNYPDKDGRYILEHLQCRIPIEDQIGGSEGWGIVQWEMMLRPLLEILLNYGAGAGLQWRAVDEKHSKCNTTVLMGCFHTLRREAMRKPPLSVFWNYEDVRDTFEGHFIRICTAGLESSNDEKAFDPPEKDLDWSKWRREAYRVRCEEEVAIMKNRIIAGSSATYFNLLTLDLSVLAEQDIWGKLTRYSCVIQFPIYGDMLYCSYLRTRRPILLMKSSEFFSILSPSLLSDCVELVMTYLSNADLESLASLCQAYQDFMERRSLEAC